MDKTPQISEPERVTHMWEPIPFTVTDDYDYLRSRWDKRIGSALFRGVVAAVLSVYNALVLGVRVQGRENLRRIGRGGAVCVCNHVHPMDCTIVDIAVLPRRLYLISLDVNFRIPVVRHIIRWLGAVPMSRSVRQIRQLLDAMGEALARGALVQVYPEGVLVPYDTGLREFHGGAFRLAVENGCPVLPMVLVQRKPRGLYRLYKRRPCLTLRMLPPVFPGASLPKRKAIAAIQSAVRTAMEQALAG